MPTRRQHYLKYDERKKMRERVLKMRRNNVSFAKIAEIVQIPAGTLRDLVAGFTAPKLPKRRPFEEREDMKATARALRTEGKTWREVAETLGVPMPTIYAACNYRSARDFGPTDQPEFVPE